MIRIQDFVASHVVLLMRLAACTAICSGLIGGLVWFVALADRSDGDDLRWGFLHNPFMQFPPFNETFLDLSLWVLLACSAAAGLGGLMLLARWKWGLPLVTAEARVSIAFNTVIAFFIVAILIGMAKERRPEAFISLSLRLGSIAVDLVLWTFLSGSAVREFLARQGHPSRTRV